MCKQRKTFITLFIGFIATLACALVSMLGVSVRADYAGEYVYVSQTHFSFEAAYNNASFYQIQIEYVGDEPWQCGGYHSYQTANVAVTTDDEDVLYISSIDEYGSKTSIKLNFHVVDKDGKIGYKKAQPTKITIPAGTVLLSGCGNGCAGIQFITEFSLYKLSEFEWTTEQPIQSYGVQMTTENTAFGWNNERQCLTAQITVPYMANTGNVYETNFETYDGEVVAEQTDDTKVTLYYGDTQVLQETDDFASFTIPVGTFISEALAVQVTLAGALTFHKYVDGSWSVQKYICVRETVDGVTSEQKLSTDGIYVLPNPECPSEKCFIGWENGSTLIATGTEIVLAECSAPVFACEAVYVEYNLIKGASVRLDSSLSSSGIRFGAVLHTDGSSKFVPYLIGIGVIVMPTDMIGEKPFTLENYNGVGEAKYFYTPKEQISFEKNAFTLYGSIIKVLEQNYNRAFSARAYLRIQQGENIVYVWDEHIQSSSVYEVAQKAYQDNIDKDEKTILECYLNNVLDICHTSVDTTLIGPVVDKSATLVSCVIDRGVVTVTIQTDKEQFPCVSYNGTRIKNANQTYEDGRLYIQFQEI